MGPKTREKQEMPFKTWYLWALAGILVFSFASKVIRLGYPAQYYFDEVYHAFTATRYLASDAQAYDPWAHPPAGVAFEWTHPPLAKLIMAGFMKVFGENGFGWRIGSVLFGTGVVGVTALLALELFESWPVALLSAFLVSIEGLLFAQARIAMNDSYFMCFALFSMLFYARFKRTYSLRDLYWTGLGLGLAAASKWTTLYLFGIIAVDLGRDLFWIGSRRRLPWFNLPIALVGLPVAIYLATYVQFFRMGNGWDKFLELQYQMWAYHSHLTATHAYMSKPWQWILNLRPVWMYAAYPSPGVVSNIYNLGNSIILIAGLYAVYRLVRQEKGPGAAPSQAPSWSRWFILLSYFMLWVPWTFSPRIMLFYHYAPAVPFLCIILARWLYGLYNDADIRKRRAAVALVAASVLWFLITYPNLTGIPVPERFANAVYFSVPGWR